MYREITVTLDKVLPGPQQTRKSFKIEKMGELLQSVRANGIINPPIVFAENGHYRLIAGERRTRVQNALALMMDGWGEREALALVCQADAWDTLQSASIRQRITMTVRVAPVKLDPKSISAVENLQRENLNCIEEGEAYLLLLNEYKTVTRVSQITGRSAQLISTRIRALDLEEEIKGYMAEGRLSKDSRVIEALSSLPGPEVRLQLARRFVEKETTIKAIVLGCQKVNNALAQAGKPEERVPVQQAVVQPSPQPVAPPIEPVRSFCPGCAELVNRLAEELCQGCRGGLSEKCLTCPGVIEFMEGLIRRVDHAH